MRMKSGITVQESMLTMLSMITLVDFKCSLTVVLVTFCSPVLHVLYSKIFPAIQVTAGLPFTRSNAKCCLATEMPDQSNLDVSTSVCFFCHVSPQPHSHSHCHLFGSWTLWVYLHSFSRCCLPNHEITQNSNTI